MATLARLVEVRRNPTRWVFLVCATVPFVFLVFGLGEGERLSATAHLLAVFVLCVAEFFYPTLLVWFLLILGFSAYSAAVVSAGFQRPIHVPAADAAFFLLAGAVPAVALLFARPTRRGPPVGPTAGK